MSHYTIMRPNFKNIGSHTFSLTATAKNWASIFVSLCPTPEYYFIQSKTKIEPDLRLVSVEYGMGIGKIFTYLPAY